MAILRMTVVHMLTVKVLFVALNVPSGATALTTPLTVNGIMDGDGTKRSTSSLSVTDEVALPSVPEASI